MQNTDLQNYADLHTVGRVLLVELAWASGWDSATRWTNFQVRNFQTCTNGWAGGTSRARMD